MQKSIGILVPSTANTFAALPLLGKTCGEHVILNLADAGLETAVLPTGNAKALAPLLTDNLENVLLVSENAPCLNATTFRALAQATRPAAVLMEDMVTPLAMAVPATLLHALADNASVALVDLLESLNEQGHAVKVVHAQNPNAYVSVVDAESYGAAYRLLRDAIVRKHIANGVIVLDPERTVIEAGVQIGAGTTVYAGNTLQGKTVIGTGCMLYPNNRMDCAEIGEGVTVENSVLLHCRVGAHTTVGPFAYLRPDTAIGEHCRVGDFVEIKNSNIGDGTKVSHLTYVGDSDLGKHINLGCGVVFVNYDGKVKQRSIVDDHAFIGCNCNLVAPVHIGENAFLAAGGTVTEDVPADALYIARARGAIKEDWVKQRKEQGKL